MSDYAIGVMKMNRWLLVGLCTFLLGAPASFALTINAQPYTTCGISDCKTCVNLASFGIKTAQISTLKAANMTALLPQKTINMSSFSFSWNDTTLCIKGKISPTSKNYWTMDLGIAVIDPWWNSSFGFCNNLTLVNGTNANYTNFYVKVNVSNITMNSTDEIRIVNASCRNDGTEQARDILANATTWAVVGFQANYTMNVPNIYSVYWSSTSYDAPPATTDSLLVASGTIVNNSKVALVFNTGKTYGDGFDPIYYRPFSNGTSLQVSHGNFGEWGHQILDWVGAGTMTSSKNFTQMKNFTTTHIDNDKLNTTANCEIYANTKCIRCEDTAVIKVTGGTNAFMWALMYSIAAYKSDLTFAYRNGTGAMQQITADAGDAVYEWDGKIYQIYNETGSWSKTMMFMNANYTIANNALYLGYTGHYGNQVGGIYPANYTAGKTYTHTRLYCLDALNWTQTDMDTEYNRWDNPLTATLGTTEQQIIPTPKIVDNTTYCFKTQNVCMVLGTKNLYFNDLGVII